MASPVLILTLTLLVPLHAAAQGPSQASDTPLENVHVVTMAVHHKMPENVILYVIQTRPSKFDTSPAALDALKGLGVSDTIIRAMVGASQSPRAVPDRPAAAGEQPARPITNTDVVAMFKAGLPEDAIIASIQGKPTSFDTSPDALISLKREGATDSLVRAVVAASQSPPASSGPAAAAPVMPAPTGISPPMLAGQFAGAQPSALLIRGEEKQPLATSHAQIVQMKGNFGDDFKSVAASVAAQELVLQVGALVMAKTALRFGTGAAGALTGPLVAASMLFMNRAPTYTIISALPGSQATTKLQGSELKAELLYGEIPGLDPDAHEPILLKLSPTKSNLRLVRVQKMKLKDGGFVAGKEKILQEAVPVTVAKLGRGHVVLEATGLAPGEYGVVLRRTAAGEALLYPQTGLGASPYDPGSAVWDFSLSSSEEAKPKEEVPETKTSSPQLQ